MLNDKFLDRFQELHDKSEAMPTVASNRGTLWFERHNWFSWARAVTIIGTKSCAKAFTRVFLQRHRAAPGSGRTWAWRCRASCISG